MTTILLIEDDQAIRERLSARLSDRGHAVVTKGTGISGVEAAVSESPDVVVLDLGLPDIEGSEVLKMIRAVSDVPVVIATAQSDEPRMVELLDLGADDYLVKPFGVDQLQARIRAVLRRHAPNGDEDRIVAVGGLRIDLDSHEVLLDGQPIDLTTREFELLSFLATRVGKMTSKREILAEVWRQPYGGSDKTVDVHLTWLRRKLGERAAEPRYIHTKRGAGVRFVDPTQ